MNKLRFVLMMTGLFCLMTLPKIDGKAEEVRSCENFCNGWGFILQDKNQFKDPSWNDQSWRLLNLPHDWSIEGAFDEKNPATTGGGALPGGVGWYRKAFSLPVSDRGRKIFIRFDGVYRNSEVWINGKNIGKRPNGYITFQYDLTPYLKYGANKNVIAVRVDNSDQPNSRWYSGSGIYRNVWLEKTDPVHVDLWGTYITTLTVSSSKAKVILKTTVKNESTSARSVVLSAVVRDRGGKIIAKSESTPSQIGGGKISQFEQNIDVKNPDLWSVEHPALYVAEVTVRTQGVVTDRYKTTFGIRTFVFDRERGFLLNEKSLKINGVCDHHDLGCLGAAINTRALQRQLELLKGMGCNGIRTSHNPPAPELLDLCDRMGFIVMDEAFDMWKKSKTKYDYHLYWDQWHQRDLTDQILRDRNHPSVFIWSIGNEILEQWDSTGVAIARELASTVKQLDPTRPITSALNDPKPYNNIYKSGALDLVGFNYHQKDFESFLQTFPEQKFIGTETVSALATRGHYDMPSDSIRRWPFPENNFITGNKDNTCSAYDNCSAPWGSTHEETWKLIKKNPYLAGQYIWTGFDYLGEPTPYGWPARSSYFGIIDLAGFPKDCYYMYQSEWTSTPMLHIFPHWNWKPGTVVDVWAYSNCASVELFLNGKSLGTKSKEGDDLHLSWRVPFEQGTLLAVGKTVDGKILRQEIRTAGEPVRLELVPDRKIIHADGKDLSFITVNVLDKDGIPVPNASNNVIFSVQGDGVIAGVDNGCETSQESFRGHSIHAFNGKCLVIVRSGEHKGKVVISASASGLKGDAQQLSLK